MGIFLISNNHSYVYKNSEVKSLSRVQLFATPWTVAHQAPPSVGFSRQKYWSRLPFPSPGNLLDPGIEPRSPSLQADALTSEPAGKTLTRIDFLKKQRSSKEARYNTSEFFRLQRTDSKCKYLLEGY